MNILFLKGFNNYFNRTVKKYSKIIDYSNAVISSGGSFFMISNVNFNPNDGVATEVIVGNENQKEQSKPLDWENIGTPDYAVCYEMINNVDVIRSRWYVLESERTRAGQYRLALKRDVVAEHFDLIQNAPCFVEKGMINDKEDPLLYNKESMTVNQIKTNEIPLQDSTGCAWIVGYIAKNEPGSITDVSNSILLEGIPTEYLDPTDIPFDLSETAERKYYNFKSSEAVKIAMRTRTGYAGDIRYYNLYGWKINCRTSTDSIMEYGNNGIEYYAHIPPVTTGPYQSIYRNWIYNTAIFKSNSSTYNSVAGITASSSTTTNFDPTLLANLMKNIAGYSALYNFSNDMLNSIKNTLSSGVHYNYRDIDFLAYNNKIVKIGNTYYQIKIEDTNKIKTIFLDTTVTPLDTTEGDDYFDSFTPDSTLTTYKNNIAALMAAQINSSSIPGWTVTEVNPSLDIVFAQGNEYSIYLDKIGTEEMITSLPNKDHRNHTYDSSSDIFAIPYNPIKFKVSSSDANAITTSPNESLALARGIAEKLGENAIYDLQLVPYCPSMTIRNWFENTDTLVLSDLDSLTYTIAERKIGENTTTANFILWVSSCKGEFNINVDMAVNGAYSEALNYKISNETELYRLTSPNYNGIFEFSLAKNDGIASFNIDYTYLPYQPYIHVNPAFDGLYGQDWNDARGLICGGNFSLSYINSYWQTYQNNNKNYQQIFDRQIQNMDTNNAIAMEQAKLQAVMGGFQNALSGSITGGMIGAAVGTSGGVGGVIAGAALGGVAGIGAGFAAGAMDINWLERQQKEARSYAIDMYGYQLGNIQAMPYSISKTESLTNNNKIWPILEVYTCKPQEVDALVSKIQYDGMTIMKVGKLADYSTTIDFDKAFVKGQLIRLDGLADDFHIADAIYQEVLKGYYIIQEGGN